MRRFAIATRGTCLVLLFIATIVFAEGDPWTAGLDAYGRGDYRLALENFEAARSDGRSGPAVYYNIAVCHFELGEFDAADTSFAVVAELSGPMRPLANYNRGLVAVEQQRIDDARRFFLVAYEESGDESLRVLASTMLRRTQRQPAEAPTFGGAFGAGAGYDDNIVLRDDEGVSVNTATDSPFIEAYGSLSVPVAAVSGLRFDASAYFVDYFDNGDFNQAAAEAGLAWRWRREIWHFEAGVDVGLSTFGGDRYDNTTSVYALWDVALTPDSVLRLSYRYSDIDAGESRFAGIAGSRQQAGLRYRTWWNRQHLDISYQRESNDRRDQGVSAERDDFRMRYRMMLTGTWELEAKLAFRRSEYGDLDPDRIENRTGYSLGARYALDSGWQLAARFEVVDNDASDPLFSYSRNVFKVDAMKPF